ncbi:MAG: outer membrane beta-barrel protein [Bacteroidales bacterium]|nr:outer membrane beta-barrel protein [Bacteroidales bacterium]
MQRFSCWFLGLALLLCSLPLRAQWSGSVDFSAGLGGMEGSIVSDDKPMFHGLTQGVFQLNYKTDKFRWSTKVDGKWEPKTTDNTRFSYKNEKVGLVYKAATTRPLSTSIRSDFTWLPSKDRNYTAWILYQYKNDRANNHSMTIKGDVEEVQDFSYYYEEPVMDEHKLETGVKTYRSFNGGRSILHSSVAFQLIGSQRVNTWTVFKTDPGEGGTAIQDDELYGYAWRYRITPSSQDINLDADIHLQQTVLDGEVNLKITPGARLSTKQALDHNSGATQISLEKEEPEWKDSTRLREFFNYLSVWADPYVAADFKWKNVEAHANYAAQVYARRLNDDTHQQPLKVKGVYPVGRANIKWTISPNHSLNLTNQMSVSHPDYLKICWYDRTAGYLDQLYRGNEGLLSPKTRVYGLEYEFKYKRFISQSTVSYKRVLDEIDQTWTNEEIDGRQYKVFHWLNSSNSRSVGLTQKLGWRGKVIVANVGITYNQSRRTAKDSDKVKNSFDWKLTSDITAFLGKGWSVGADAKYQSKVATFFTIFKQYCELNVRIQKDFKKFTLYLQGKDLLDQTRETSFESEELQEFWIEQVRSNRRIYVLGAKWKF